MPCYNLKILIVVPTDMHMTHSYRLTAEKVACLQTSLIFLGLTFSVQGSPPKHPSVLNGHPS